MISVGFAAMSIVGILMMLIAASWLKDSDSKGEQVMLAVIGIAGMLFAFGGLAGCDAQEQHACEDRGGYYLDNECYQEKPIKLES